MTEQLDKLAHLAGEVFADANFDVKKAAPKLARMLTENANRPLLIALVANFLTQLKLAPKPQPQPTERKLIGRRREGRHRRKPTRVPGALAKAGEIASRKHLATAVLLRPIRGAGPLGRIKMHELRTIAQQQAAISVEFLHRGYDDAVEAKLCQMISEHGVSADPFAEVQDVINEKIAADYEQQAKLYAAKVLRDGGARIARALIEAADAQQELQ